MELTIPANPWEEWAARGDVCPRTSLNWLLWRSPRRNLCEFCHGHIEHEDNAQRGCQEGHIVLLGTHRSFRRQGLGRALLVTGMMQLQQAGITLAKLSVDAENPNQAQGLYESVGFRKHFSHLVHTKQLPTAPLRSV
ncbi:MAG: GNAT family N-acetyltransferase [Synechococcales cyanobacterium CRU_2_2]|nr:GNAT family N-acetyltransferase [Synechococcales cyanobacterium CRU_2_2]